MNITFSTDDNTKKYTLTKSENFGYTLSVTRKRTQEELDEMFNSGITKGEDCQGMDNTIEYVSCYIRASGS